MHNKLFVVDNAIAVVGGRNVGDEYFQANDDFESGDYDVFVAGPIVKNLSGTFDAFWNSALAIPIAALEDGESRAPALLDHYRSKLDDHRQKTEGTEYSRRLASGEPLAGMLSGRLPLVWTQAQVIYDSPEEARVTKGEMVGGVLHQAVANDAATVQSELLLVTPYFVPGAGGMQLFKELRQRDVGSHFDQLAGVIDLSWQCWLMPAT
jgi:putative cardiolipin synthase